MSGSSSKPPPPHLHLHVDTSATAATTTANGSAASPGSESSSHSHSSRAASAGGSGSGHNPNPNPACAACKYQRRKCALNCPLAPYFPSDQQRRFLNAHRLFGVSNIQKTLRRIDPKHEPDAMRSLIYQSEARAADPVGGCVGIIEELQRQIRHTQMELQFVRQQIAICRQQTSATDDPAAAVILPAAAASSAVAGHGQQDAMVPVDAIYGGQVAGGSGLVFHSQDHRVLINKVEEEEEHNDPSSQQQQQQLYDYFYYNNGTAAGDEATSDVGGVQQYLVVDSSVKQAAGSPVALAGEQLGKHCQIEQPLPFVDAFNVKPQVVLPATIQRHGPAAAGDHVLHPEQKVAMPPVLVKHDDEDEHMAEEEQATAGAPCHLELGFSSAF